MEYEDYCKLSLAPIYLCVFGHLLIAIFFLGIAVLRVENNKPMFSVFIVSNKRECKTVCNKIVQDCSEYKVIGIDAEWVTVENIRNPVALLQLCSVKGTCGLFRLNKLGRMADSLKTLLGDPEIVKVGLVPENDAKYLFQDYGISVKSTLDLCFLYGERKSLARLAKEQLNITLDKNYKIRCSDWEAEKLLDAQVTYAAMDAYAAIEIFKKWSGIHFPLKFWKRNPAWWELEADFVGQINKKFDVKEVSIKNIPRKGRQHFQQLIEAKPSLKKHVIQKKIIYDHCWMKAPDDTILSTISKSKAEWYLSKGFAVLESSEPLTIKLLFEPKVMKPLTERDIMRKEDLCVVCGSTKDLLKHWVVPRMYSKHFPLEKKNHCSFDVVLFCLCCHLEKTRYDIVLKKRLEKLVEVPERPARNLDKTSSHAHALLNRTITIPAARRYELEEIIKAKYNVKELTDEFLQQVEQKVTRTEETVSGGQLLVEHYCSGDRTIQELQETWRKHFIDTMKPKYLPTMWTVDHKN